MSSGNQYDVIVIDVIVALALLNLAAYTVSAKNTHHHAKASMLTRGQEHVVTAGNKISLECEFHMHNFSMFDNPIVWEKQQKSQKTKLNIMGVVQEPFATTRRYDIILHLAQPPRYRLRLKIKDAAVEDSGNYTCEVRGRKSLVLDKVVHIVEVRAPIKWVHIVPGKLQSDREFDSTEPHPIASLSLKEGDSMPLRCVSDGGYPEPHFTIAIDDRDVTDQFETTHISESTGPRGLRTIHFRSTCSISDFTVTSEDHGKTLQCSATVKDVGAASANVTLLVSYAPKIYCESVAADVGDEKVELRCHVNARPSSSSVYWFIDSNFTVVNVIGHSDVTKQYSTLVRDRGNNQLESVLTITRVHANSFGTYILRADNQIGNTSHSVTLRYKSSSKSRLTTSTADLSFRNFKGQQNPVMDQSELRMSPASNDADISAIDKSCCAATTIVILIAWKIR